LTCRKRTGILFFAGVLLLSCSLVSPYGEILLFPPTTTPDPNIVFVTPTPPDDAILHENMRSQPAPQAGSTPVTFFPGANEMGKVLVLEYHRLGYPDQRYQRSPAGFRTDLERLYQNGYYPVNFVDLVRGLPHVPAGKKPVVLTFDDSDISQFRVLDDHTVDAETAVGILLNFNMAHPDWPTRATFFVLGNDNGNYISIFGQPDWAKSKVRFLVDQGMEVGSHTVNHTNLGATTAERIEWELAVSQFVIEDLAPGYEVQSLSVPYGEFPYTLDFLKAGQWGNFGYTYSGNAAAWGGPSVSPHNPAFDPYRIPRMEVTADSINHWLSYFEEHPAEYYISDGDPNRMTAPDLDEVAQE
jgi:peptidoglycan/xylan/chitin deacetylase (PgdA/CDA1 family)